MGENGLVPIKLLIGMPGQFHGHRDLPAGAIVSIDSVNARRYVKLKYASFDLDAALPPRRVRDPRLAPRLGWYR